MEMPIRLVARGFEMSPPLEELVRERSSKLSRFHGRILGCAVFIEGPGGHHRRGIWSVRIEVHVPGPNVVLSRQAGPDLRSTLGVAFRTAARRLHDLVDRRRGFVKTHAAQEYGAHALGG